MWALLLEANLQVDEASFAALRRPLVAIAATCSRRLEEAFLGVGPFFLEMRTLRRPRRGILEGA